jgi:hypothetical protein
MDAWTVDPSLYKIEKYFLYELEHGAIHGVKSDSKMNQNGWYNL